MDIHSLLASQNFSKTEKYLAILAHSTKELSNAEIRAFAKEHGWAAGAKSSPSPFLSGGKAANTATGWKLTQSGKEYLSKLGIAEFSEPLSPLIEQVINIASTVKSPERKRFLEEACNCLRSQSHRAAIVFSWVGAVWILYEQVFHHHLSPFLSVAKKRGKLKNGVNAIDDFRRLKESEFLDICETIKFLTTTEKRELIRCLDRRNDAGHPNDYDPGEGAVADHLETLIKHVFSKY